MHEYLQHVENYVEGVYRLPEHDDDEWSSWLNMYFETIYTREETASIIEQAELSGQSLVELILAHRKMYISKLLEDGSRLQLVTPLMAASKQF